MFGNTFYYSTIRKTVIAFGTLFNDINVVRVDSSGNEKQRIKVPLAYGPRERFLTRAKDDPNLDRPTDFVLPRMSFTITTMNYAGVRKLNTMGKNLKPVAGDNTQLQRVFNVVTYELGFELSIISKNIDDGNQILEQILPWFTPDYTVTIKTLNELDLVDDVPITLQSITPQDNYDDVWIERRNIVWTLNFSAKIGFYGPIKDQKVITKAQVDGLIATGADLTDPDDLATIPRIRRQTVVPDPLDADPASDFGYTETTEDFNDGKKYNPVTGDDEDV